MSKRLLLPNRTPHKVICLTRTDRWHSAVRHCSNHDQLVSTLDWEDLAKECDRWSGCVAVVEVNEENLESACRFTLSRRRSRSQCCMFAVTDFSSIATNSEKMEAANVLATAGYHWTCDSPLKAPRLFRMIKRYQTRNPAPDRGIEEEFRQRLPWKRVGRYAVSRFKPTRFSI